MPSNNTAPGVQDSSFRRRKYELADNYGGNRKYDAAKPDTRPVELSIQRIGVYGWRKYCLYCSVLLMTCLALVNLGLVLWVIEVMELESNRAGPMHFRKSSLSVRGDAEFTKGIVCNKFSGFDNNDLVLESNENVQLRAVDAGQTGGSAITLSSGQIETVTPTFQASFEDQVYFKINNSRLEFSANEVLVDSDAGLVVNGEIQAHSIQNTYELNQGLVIESIGQSLDVSGATNVDISSQTGSIGLQAFRDLRLESEQGVHFSGGEYVFADLPTLPEDDAADSFNLCVCQSGQLFRVASTKTCSQGQQLC